MLRIVRATAITLSVCGFLVPDVSLLAGEPAQLPQSQTATNPVVIDVALASGGTLVGRVLDAQHHALAGATVSVRQGQREVATAVTDKEGRFQVSHLRGGVYQVVAADGQGLFRVWAADTAPPSSRDKVLLVAGSMVVRGQSANGVVYSDAGNVLYDENGVPYGQVRLVNDAPGGMYYEGGGGFWGGGLDPLVTLTAAGAITGAILGGIALSDINDVKDDLAKVPKSP